jgi:ABC-type antimicrobial peptide transport system permease subunit
VNPGLLKLAVVGSRSAYGRLSGIAGGVAVGVCLLLLLWGGANGLSARDDRGAWLRETGRPSVAAPLTRDDPTASGPGTPVPLTADTVLMEANPVEVFRDQLLNRRDVAALGSTSVKIPGIGSPPAPGQYYASPALQRLIESTPRNELGDRFGTFAGTIDDAALPGPDSLIVVTGATEAKLRQNGRAFLVSDFTTNPYGGSAAAYNTVLSIGAIAVFFPVLLLISVVTGLGAAQRRERFATLRLIGASPRVVSLVAAVETAVPSLIGAVLGVVLAVALRPAAAQIPVNGTRMFAADLTTGWVAAAAVVAVVVAASALVAAHRTARAGIGPLGVTRAVHEKTPTMWRTLPLLAGLVAMITAVLMIRVLEVRHWLDSPLLILGFLLILVGIVVIGPWLTRLVSRIGLRRARSASAVIAASRIHKTPVATFRSVSGLVIAVFVVSVFAGGSSVIESSGVPSARPGLLQPTSLHATVSAGHTPAQAAEAGRQANDLPGIRSATVGYGPGALSGPDAGPEIYLRAADAIDLGFEDIPATEAVAVDTSFLQYWTTQPLALTPAPAANLDGLVPVVIVVDTDGTPEAMDRARTLLNGSGITAIPAMSPLDLTLQSSTRLIQGLAVLAYLGMFVAIAIAGLSLAVATASAVLDRKRVLGLMRLMGMPVSVLRRIITREAAVPLLAVLVLSVGLGFLVAWLMVAFVDDTYRVSWPAPGYFMALGVSLFLALAAVTATFGLIRSQTALTATRFE